MRHDATDQIGVLKRQGANPQRQVDAFGNHIDLAITGFQMHFHARVHGHESRDDCANAFLQQRSRAGNTQHAARLGVGHGDRRFCGFGLLEHGAAMVVIALPQFRHREVSGVTDDQAHTQPFFELRDAPAKVGFGNTQRTGGRRETAVVHHHNEVLKVIEIQHSRIPFNQKAPTIQG